MGIHLFPRRCIFEASCTNCALIDNPVCVDLCPWHQGTPTVLVRCRSLTPSGCSSMWDSIDPFSIGAPSGHQLCVSPVGPRRSIGAPSGHQLCVPGWATQTPGIPSIPSALVPHLATNNECSWLDHVSIRVIKDSVELFNIGAPSGHQQ